RASWPRIERWTGHVDVVHGTNFVGPPARVPVVVTGHDVTFARFPELCTAHTLRYPHLLRNAIARAAHVHALSGTVRDEVRELFEISPDRVVTIYAGLMPSSGGDPARGRAHAGGDRYVLALGQLEPRKNLPHLVRAFDRVASRHDDLRLVVAGP